MKSRAFFFFIGVLLIPVSLYSQNRMLGCDGIVLDDNANHRFQLLAPTGLSSSTMTYQFPQVPAGGTPSFINAGITNCFSYWNGSYWTSETPLTLGNANFMTASLSLTTAGASTNGFVSYLNQANGSYWESGLAAIGGTSDNGFGVFAASNTNDGLEAITTSGNAAILAQCVLPVNSNVLVCLYGAGAGGSTPTANNCAIFENSTGNVARIDNAGKGFFDGGTQNSGADVAEVFAVEGTRSEYQPGDVLVVSTKSDRTVEKCSESNSKLVVGVYATKPGVTLTEENMDADLSGKVPMGVIGVIPTKVSCENGAIHRGDLLVTSSTPGHAMKAPLNPAVGTVIGKALQNLDSGTGKINVLVNIR